jgi:ABC-type transport system involved in multi-copper enzyme maturation permease subunit
MTTLSAGPTRLERFTASGVFTVAAQEFRIRIRAGRWRWLLAIWTAVVIGFAVLLRLGLAGTDSVDSNNPAGPPLFGGTLLFVLGLALLVVPALTAQSVNGDRERGTLATLQVTRLSASEIGLGKLVAAWGAALIFLALTLPVIVWAMIEGGLPFINVVVTLLVVSLLLGVVSAVSQAWSAVFARSITSALVSYLTVFALTIGTLIAFGLLTALTTEARTFTYAVDDGNAQTYTEQQTRTDRTWPLLAPNPFVVLADAAPRLPERRDPVTGEPLGRPLDPLGSLGDTVRDARRGPDTGTATEGPGVPAAAPDQPGPIWPWGLGFDVALGVGAAVVTVRRLRMPMHKIGRGVRIA